MDLHTIIFVGSEAKKVKVRRIFKVMRYFVFKIKTHKLFLKGSGR